MLPQESRTASSEIQFSEDRKTRIQSLRSEIEHLRYRYSKVKNSLTESEWVIVGNAFKVIAAHLNGEIARNRHQLRDYMIGLDITEADGAGQRHATELEGYISDIVQAKQTVARYENTQTRDLAMSAGNKLTIEAEEYRVASTLDLIKHVTSLLEMEIYDGQG